jgi:hypothetical protein
VSWVYVRERPSTGFGSVRTQTMIASYPSGKATTLFHGSVHKDIAWYVGREESDGPDEFSDSVALPLPNNGLQPTPTASAPASLRLSARLRPGVRLL